MRPTKQTVVHALLFVLITTVTYSAASAQFIQPYLSQDEVEAAVSVAKDSIGTDAVLIGIATTGEIDLEPVGLPGTVEGFNEGDGTSSVWGYQFSTPNGSREVGVVVINFGILPQVIRTEDGNIFGVSNEELDLSGDYSDSDKFASKLRENGVFQEYREDYPDVESEAVVLAAEPDDADLFLPGDFPRTLPLWSIFFNTDTWSEGDSSLICFMATGTGQTLCFRSSVSTVGRDIVGTGTTLIALQENVVRRQSTSVISVRITPGPGMTIQSCTLYDAVGRAVVELNEVVGSTTTSDLSVPVAALPSGQYYLVLTDESGSHAERIILK